MRPIAFAALVAAFAANTTGAAHAQSTAMVQTETALRDHGLAGSVAYPVVESLTTEVGARPAGSPAQKRAMQWALAKMRALGLANVHVEPFTVTAWVRGPEAAEITAPYPQRLAILGLGGSVPTPPGGIEAPIVLFHTYADLLAQPPGALAGKIAVVTQPMARTQTGAGYGALIAMRTAGPSEAAKRGAVAYLLRSLSTAEDRFPHTGATRYDPGAPAIPAAALSPADASLIDRMAARGSPITIRLSLDSHTIPGASAWNVVGEVVGRETPDEVVMVGGHLDSWDPGTGAIDDGAGLAIATAAVKLIADLPQPPRRTVRLVYFGSEEMGGSGAAYAAAHTADAGKIILAGESDEGSGAAWSLRLPAGALAVPAMHDLTDVLTPMKIIIDPTPAIESGADIDDLHGLGVPVASFQVNAWTYFDTHHSADDILERVDPKGLDQNAAAWAAMLYAAAESGVDFRATAAKP